MLSCTADRSLCMQRLQPWHDGVMVCRCRLDSIVGLTAAGCAPSASADPYALRRSAQGMLQVRH